jgi:hypothetical protein
LLSRFIIGASTVKNNFNFVLSKNGKDGCVVPNHLYECDDDPCEVEVAGEQEQAHYPAQ